MFHRVDDDHRVVEVRFDGGDFAVADEGGAGVGLAALTGWPPDDGVAGDADGLYADTAPSPWPVEDVRRERADGPGAAVASVPEHSCHVR